MPTLLLPPRQSVDASALWRAAIRMGWKSIRLQRWAVPEELEAGEEVVLYSGWACAISDDLKVALLEPPLDWLATVPFEYLKREIRFTTLGEARMQGTPAFIKPADGKSFPSSRYESGKELLREGVLSEETPVLVSELVEWRLEFRCFVLEGKVETLSVYLRDRVLAENEEGEWVATEAEVAAAREFAERVLGDERVKVPPAVVLDVGLLSTGEWAVIETNAAWGSGIYGCDAEAVLRVLRRVCVPNHRLTDEDRKWIITRSTDFV